MPRSLRRLVISYAVMTADMAPEVYGNTFDRLLYHPA
jgi:hypothetical protein